VFGVLGVARGAKTAVHQPRPVLARCVGSKDESTVFLVFLSEGGESER